MNVCGTVKFLRIFLPFFFLLFSSPQISHYSRFAAPDVVEVMSFPRFAHKRIGYLAASVSFTSNTDILIMSTNLFRKDVTSSNQYEAGIALSALACVVTPDLARDLAPDIVTLLSSSKPYVRKKAILVLYSIFCAFPDSLRPAFPKLREKLKDEELPIVSAAVSVLLELARKNPNNYIKLAPTLFHLLTAGSAHAWLQLKLVKLFALLCPVEPRLPKRLVEPLTNIINTTPVMSLLYECINTCTTGLVKHLPIVRLCIQKLRMFIESPDQNHKYLGLLALGNIMSVHPKAVREHKDTVMHCLDDEDESIRLRALDLLVGMVDKKNLADVIDRLLEHLTFKAEGHYKSQLISKIITIACQRDFKYIIDFEWYLGVLVRLAYVPGNEQGALLSDQLMDVVVRVDVVRRFAVKEALHLLQDPRFYSSQSKIVEILYASAWIVGEFSERKEAVAVVSALLDPVAKSVPGHIQAMFVSNALKVFSRMCGQLGGSGADLLALSPQKADAPAPVDEKLNAAIERCLALLDQNLGLFAESEVVEVQERALFAQQVLRIYRSVGSMVVATELAQLFAAPLNPVHPQAQGMVAVPDGLDLNAQINEWPEEESPEASWDDEPDPQSAAAFEFGGYQQPGSATSGYTTAPLHKQQGPTGPVDKRYYLTGTIVSPAANSSTSASSPGEPAPVPVDLGPGAPRLRTSQKPPKGGGKKAVPVKVVTALAMPAGAAVPPGAVGAKSAAGQARGGGAGPASALSNINLDEEVTAEEKTLLTAKVYPNQTAPKQQPQQVPIVVGGPAPVVAAVAAPGGKGKKEKGGKRSKGGGGGSTAAGAAAAKSPPQPLVPSDASAPQVMCNTDKLSCICRVVGVDSANAKQVTAQIAIQNRTPTPLINVQFDFGPLPSGIKLVSRSLPNPFAVAASGVAPLLCEFQVPEPIHAPTLIGGSIVMEQGANPISFSFLVMPSLFVSAEKISLEELGKRISTQAALLKTASGVLVCTDQKAGLKRVAEKLRVKKIRIESGAALFYGRTVHGTDIFVHIKRASETSMNVEIKTPDQSLSQTLVNQAIAN